MNRKNKSDNNGIIYSTDPGFSFQEQGEEQQTLGLAQQKLKVKVETKHRAGKTVSTVTGFIGTAYDEAELAKKIKTHCGTGGSVKDGEIIVQGNHVEKILQWLLKNGYTQTKKSG